MIKQLIEIAEEEYDKHRKEVDNLTQRIEEANWGEITTKNYAILNSIIDRYEEDIIQRKNRKFRRDLFDYQHGRVYTFSKKYDNIKDSNLSLDPKIKLRVAANTEAVGALRWQENILCTATPAPTTVVPRPDAWRHREGDRGAKISRPAQAPSFQTERAWLEGWSRVKGEPHTVRLWNRLTSRRTVRSSLHEILRSSEEIRRGVEDPHSTRRSCRRSGTTEKAQTSGDEGTISLPPPSSPFPPLSINRKPSEDRSTPPPHRDIKRNHLSSSPP
ncbi:hypothetical protein NDU88_010387 [Pleurodeles waltl]|uniref:Uncharacterized protein n=1 Tax=Pleurodeles waltl TaxID=8319 RepID=A0AAV7QY39_PLEWA|nr:hypothetical protein NDU88_010387 [Pleurodeles waltl]